MASAIESSTLDSLGLAASGAQQRERKTELGQEEFLKLMTTQMQNQDPFAPMENGEFMGQIAQFSSVSGIQELQKSFEQLASSLISNQALQASTLVGRSALAESSYANLPADGSMIAGVELESSASNVMVAVIDGSGQLVERIELGPQAPGVIRFEWNGVKADNSYAAPGTYRIEAAAYNGTTSEAVPTLASGTVDSVVLGKSGTEINLLGLGSVSFNQIREIH